MMGLKKYIRNKKGQSVVETALVLPIVLMLIFGIIEFGRVFNAYMIVNNASREAARYAAVGKEYTDIASKVNSMTSTLSNVEIQVDEFIPNIYDNEVDNYNDNRIQGESVTVKVTHKLTLVTPIIGPLLSDPGDSNKMTISSTTSMRVE